MKLGALEIIKMRFLEAVLSRKLMDGNSGTTVTRYEELRY